MFSANNFMADSCRGTAKVSFDLDNHESRKNQIGYIEILGMSADNTYEVCVHSEARSFKRRVRVIL